MEKKSDFFRKPGMLFVLFSLLVFAGLGAAFGEGMQNREAYAARTEAAAKFSGTRQENQNFHRGRSGDRQNFARCTESSRCRRKQREVF